MQSFYVGKTRLHHLDMHIRCISRCKAIKRNKIKVKIVVGVGRIPTSLGVSSMIGKRHMGSFLGPGNVLPLELRGVT